MKKELTQLDLAFGVAYGIGLYRLVESFSYLIIALTK